MTLRRRLVAVQVVLVTVGLAAFGVVSYSLYSRSQYQRIDAELSSAAPFLGRVVSNVAAGQPSGFEPYGPPAGGPGGGGNNRPTTLPSGSYAELLSPALKPLGRPEYVACIENCSKPVLPATISPGTKPGGRLLTVASSDGSSSYRVLIRYDDPAAGGGFGPGGPVLGPGNDILVAAVPMDDVTRSLHRLIITDLAVGAAVLVALSVTGLLIVRRGLRPLERMSATARAIAGGDLSQRANPADERSEVGQLGAAFNAMMGNIQQAFTERDNTEARLRQFLADASHELRTPLTSIRGYAELYRMGAAPPGEDLERVMDRIETHAKEMGGLVEELLLLARLDQTRPPERVDVDLAVLAAESCHDLAVTAPDRRLTFDAPEPVHVVGDPAHLRQAVANLLTNAQRHTPPGSPIEVTVTAAGAVATVAVRDHGSGLADDGLAHAFDRFWRADSSRRGSGAGLGLAIVAAVASEHGGLAQVANAVDGGAMFTVRLPLPATAASAAAGPAAGVGANGGAGPNGGTGPRRRRHRDSQLRPKPYPGDSEEVSPH